MNTDPVTIHYLTWQGVDTLLTAVLVAVVVALVWLMLFGSEREKPLKRDNWFAAASWALLPIWFWLLGATLWGLWQVFNGVKDAPLASGSLGLGALIAAFLGAPFVIYGTYLRHNTNRLEQEGHMTDRINKAVEQLGAEKTVKKQLISSRGKKVFEKGADEQPDYSRPVIIEESVPNIEVRIGAILSLERIAQDSTFNDNGRDHVRVMEILCAYIRENSQGSDAKKSLRVLYEAEREDPEMPEEYFNEWFCEQYNVHPLDLQDRISVAATKRWAANLPKPRADVQLALTVIGRRNADQRRAEAAWPKAPTQATVWPFDPNFKRLPDDPSDAPLSKVAQEAFEVGLEAWKANLHAYRGYRLDLRGANLQGADMAAKQPDGSDAVFSGARLDGTRMEGAKLMRARMEGTELTLARMEGADLTHARVQGANFGQACLEAAALEHAQMVGAYLGEARLDGAVLGWARMESANLVEVRMHGADLREARMEGANLKYAWMEGAILDRARLDGAVLDFARIWNASFEKANLSRANMRFMKMGPKTNFSEADLTYAALQEVDFSTLSFQNLITSHQAASAFGDLSVQLPASIQRPKHWTDDFLEDLNFEIHWRRWQACYDGKRPPPKPD